MLNIPLTQIAECIEKCNTVPHRNKHNVKNNLDNWNTVHQTLFLKLITWSLLKPVEPQLEHK